MNWEYGAHAPHVWSAVAAALAVAVWVVVPAALRRLRQLRLLHREEGGAPPAGEAE